MENALKRKIAGGAAGLALLAGAGGAAFAASSDPPGRTAGYDRDSFLVGGAKRVNGSPQAPKGASRAGAKEDCGPPLLGPGRGPGRGPGFGSQGGPPPPGAPPPLAGPPPPGRPPGPPGPIMAGLDASAKYLGLTQ